MSVLEYTGIMFHSEQSFLKCQGRGVAQSLGQNRCPEMMSFETLMFRFVNKKMDPWFCLTKTKMHSFLRTKKKINTHGFFRILSRGRMDFSLRLQNSLLVSPNSFNVSAVSTESHPRVPCFGAQWPKVEDSVAQGEPCKRDVEIHVVSFTSDMGSTTTCTVATCDNL